MLLTRWWRHRAPVRIPCFQLVSLRCLEFEATVSLECLFQCVTRLNLWNIRSSLVPQLNDGWNTPTFKKKSLEPHDACWYSRTAVGKAQFAWSLKEKARLVTSSRISRIFLAVLLRNKATTRSGWIVIRANNLERCSRTRSVPHGNVEFQ